MRFHGLYICIKHQTINAIKNNLFNSNIVLIIAGDYICGGWGVNGGDDLCKSVGVVYKQMYAIKRPNMC